MAVSRQKLNNIQSEAAERLESCIQSFGLTEEEQEAIRAFNSLKTVKKGTLLLKEGDFFSSCFYILKGCVRQYYLVDGEEKTTFFYTEDQSISSSLGPNSQIPSKFYLECTEDTSLTITTYEEERDLYKRFPRLESFCRATAEQQLSISQEMFATFKMSSPEERYLNILKTRPELIHRVPQYQLASFLGIKPESLSRIRKRISINHC